MRRTLKRMREILGIRGYSPKTVEAYVSRVAGFLSFFAYPVGQLTQEFVHKYLVYLKDVRKLSGSTINQTLFAIKFLFTQVLHKPWDLSHFRCHKRRRKLPVILSLDESSESLPWSPI